MFANTSLRCKCHCSILQMRRQWLAEREVSTVQTVIQTWAFWAICVSLFKQDWVPISLFLQVTEVCLSRWVQQSDWAVGLCLCVDREHFSRRQMWEDLEDIIEKSLWWSGCCVAAVKQANRSVGVTTRQEHTSQLQPLQGPGLCSLPQDCPGVSYRGVSFGPGGF